MVSEINMIHGDIMKIQKDLQLIKNILFSEGELSSWAKRTLEEERNRSESEYTDLNDL
mgnify:CR=1 FL=1